MLYLIYEVKKLHLFSLVLFHMATLADPLAVYAGSS